MNQDDVCSLRDIFVVDRDERDWQRVLDVLRASHLAPVFRVDGRLADLPPSVADIFALRRTAAPALEIDVAGVRLGSYFFDPSLVEFDFDPRDVRDEEQASRLIAFLRTLGELLAKPVIVAHEGCSGDPIIRLDPVLQEAG